MTIVGATAVFLLLALVPQAFGALEHVVHRAVAALCVVVFAFFFVTVSSRIVGLVGVTSNPTSGMTIASLLGTSAVFLALGWTDDAGKMGALTVGTVVAIAASIAGDMSQDLKTGYLVGATPDRIQIGADRRDSVVGCFRLPDRGAARSRVRVRHDGDCPHRRRR